MPKEMYGLIGTVAGAVIAGIFLIIAKILEIKHKNVPIPATTIISTTGDYRHTVYVSLGKVLLHIGIVQLAINIVGFIVGFFSGMLKIPNNILYFNFSLFMFFAYILSFEWVAAKVDRKIRWKHMICVVIGVIVITLISNSMIVNTPIGLTNIAINCVIVPCGMAAGGAITNAIKPD